MLQRLPIALSPPAAGYNSLVRAFTLYAALVLLAVLLCTAGGCGAGQGSLQQQAISYYNYMAGRSPKTKYSSFLSPAYRSQFKGADLKQLNKAMARSEKASTRYPEVKAANVAVSVFREKNGQDYGYSVVDPQLGDAYANLRPVRWVRAGWRWYVYLGSDAELKRYGTFPGGFGPPAPPKPQPTETSGKGKEPGKPQAASPQADSPIPTQAQPPAGGTGK